MTGRHRYLIALGSNMRVPGIGSPRRVVAAALERLCGLAGDVTAISPIVASDPVGPSRRRYANAAAILESPLEPLPLLAELQRLERAFGRRRRGRIWGARTLDCDIVLWSGGRWHDPRLTVPHPHYHIRQFVLGPACAIAPHWRDPATRLTVAQTRARLTRPRPLPR